ncbi:hypothetical protein Aph02nite_59800 [Actinoplanes philippinensis]|uniref:Uncharacterized protein n=1 Tax=Actinoplanes philippinensis TaxID=35752 RepID=A0A1I2JIE3_9ACTN|nr:hypothetical protein [Actinoplanes philippinensis]GIE80030.1 hypothetical protein Aph02nite_59800 [Actinoplanes philippinensis]SFF52937.1 hypothetical protein SAMN05421541_112190 [Actinoplanes philippinensis]
MTKNSRHLVMPTILAAAAIAFTGTQITAPQPTTSATGTTQPVVVPTDLPGVPLDPKQPITHDWPW